MLCLSLVSVSCDIQVCDFNKEKVLKEKNWTIQIWTLINGLIIKVYIRKYVSATPRHQSVFYLEVEEFKVCRIFQEWGV